MCDLLVALPPATADGATLFAKNSDRPPEEAQVVEWFPPHRDLHTRATWITVPRHRGATIGFVGSRPTWMWGVEHGVNEAGVAAGNATIYTTLDPRGFPDALTGMDLVRLALERSSTAHEAVGVVTALIEEHGQGGSGHAPERRPYWSSFLIADPTQAWVIETSGQQWDAEQVERTRALSNRTSIAAFDEAHRHPSQPVEALVDPRLDASRAVLAAEPVSRDRLEQHLGSHTGGDDGWTVCMHVEGVESTTAAMTAELPVGAPPRGRFLLGSPCAGAFTDVAPGGPIPDALRPSP